MGSSVGEPSVYSARYRGRGPKLERELTYMAVSEEAIEKIKGMIMSGELQPGDRLPKEDELAGSLGISRSSLRKRFGHSC